MRRLNYNELRNRYLPDQAIPYVDLLNTVEWIKRRDQIVLRDKYKCTNCGRSETVRDYLHHDTTSGTDCFVWVTDEYPYYKDDDGKLVKSGSPLLEHSDKPYFLHVHHKKYILGRLPWEYNDNDLTTLCNWCHWAFHKDNKVPVYRFEKNELKEVDVTPCTRCHGAGWFPEYDHIQNGVCFRCRGNKFEELIPK